MKNSEGFVALLAMVLILGNGCGNKERGKAPVPPAATQNQKLPVLEQNLVHQSNLGEPSDPPDYSFQEVPDSFDMVQQAEADLLNPPAD